MLIVLRVRCWGRGFEQGPQAAQTHPFPGLAWMFAQAAQPGAEGGASRVLTAGCESARGASRGRGAPLVLAPDAGWRFAGVSG